MRLIRAGWQGGLVPASKNLLGHLPRLFAEGLFHQQPCQFQSDGHPILLDLYKLRAPLRKPLLAINDVPQLDSDFSQPFLDLWIKLAT